MAVSFRSRTGPRKRHGNYGRSHAEGCGGRQPWASGRRRLPLSSSHGMLIYGITDTAWEIAGTGDFNKDGNTDILWRYYGTGPYQGLNDVWYMNGTKLSRGGLETDPGGADPETGRSWGPGTSTNDGNTDILWRYNGNLSGTNGFTWIWYMNGTNVIGGAQVLLGVRT